MDKDKFRKWIRDNQANDPNTSLCHAKSLKKAADIVLVQIKIEMKNCVKPGHGVSRSDPTLWPVYMMLSGFAIENLIKGIYIIKNDGALDTNGDLKKKLSKHVDNKKNLLSGKNTLSQLDDSDYSMIERLEMYAQSWGRYGVEKLAERKILNNVSVNDRSRIPMTGKIKDDVVNILEKNKKGDFTVLTTVSNFFDTGHDPIQINKTYSTLEEILTPHANAHRPDFAENDSNPGAP